MTLLRLLFYVFAGWWIYRLFENVGREKRARNSDGDFIEVTMGAFAKFAKADGRISEREIAAVERIIESWTLGEETARRARNAFRVAKDDEGSFEDYVAQATAFTASVRYIFLDCLVALACAEDSGMNAKAGMLTHAASKLGFTVDLLRALIAKHTPANFRNQQYRANYGWGKMEGDSLDSDYALLGVSPNASDAELKRAYRNKAMELHPDRLQAQGLPPQMVKVATENLARVNTAYERIKKGRGF